MIVTFFGDADAPSEIYPKLLSTILYLIEHKEASLFFVGYGEDFYQTVNRALEAAAEKHPKIRHWEMQPPPTSTGICRICCLRRTRSSPT